MKIGDDQEPFRRPPEPAFRESREDHARDDDRGTARDDVNVVGFSPSYSR